MGIRNIARTVNNASISNFNGFDRKIIAKIYRKNFPDFSDMEPATKNDRIIEHAYSLAAADDRSYLLEADVLSAITNLSIKPDGVLSKILGHSGETAGQLSNIKIIKKGHVGATDAPKVSSASGGVRANVAVPKPTPIQTSTGTFSSKVKQAITSLIGSRDLIDIEKRAFEDAPPRDVFMGHNTDGTSDKYYLVFNRSDGRVLAFWGRVGKPPSSKVYEPSAKTYSQLVNEKKKKGYQTVVEE